MTASSAFLLAGAALFAWPNQAARQRLNAANQQFQQFRGEKRREGNRAAFARPASPQSGSGARGLVLPLGVAAVAVLCGAGIGLATGIAIVVGAVLRVIGAERRRAAAKRDAAGWVGALDVIHADVCSGAPVAAALRGACRSASGVVAAELQQACALETLGGRSADRLRAAEAVAARRLGVALTLVAEYGVPLADIIRRCADDVAAVEEHVATTDAALAGPRTTALVLTGLPLLGICFGQAMGAAPLATLSNGLLGGALAVIGATLMATGLLWAHAIVNGARK